MANKKFPFLLIADAFLCTVFTCIVSGLLYFFILNLSILDPFEKAFEDFEFTDIYYAEGFYKKEAAADIIVINVEQADRYMLAQALQKISAYQPKAVGLDLLFKERKTAFEDDALQAALQQVPNLVKAVYFDQDTLITSAPYFQTPTEQQGFINFNLDGSSSVVRDFNGVLEYQEREIPSLAGALAVAAGYVSTASLKTNYTTPVPIRYTGGSEAFLTLSVDELLSRERLDVLTDAVVLLGYAGTPTGNPFDIEDKHFTPLNAAFTGRATPDTFGVFIHATILQNLKSGKTFTALPKMFTLTLAFLIAFGSILLGMYIHKKSNFIFDISVKVLQLLVPIVLLYLVLHLLSWQIYLNVLPVILLVILGLECIDFYIYLQEFIRKKYPWKSYLLD